LLDKNITLQSTFYLLFSSFVFPCQTTRRHFDQLITRTTRYNNLCGSSSLTALAPASKEEINPSPVTLRASRNRGNVELLEHELTAADDGRSLSPKPEPPSEGALTSIKQNQNVHVCACLLSPAPRHACASTHGSPSFSPTDGYAFRHRSCGGSSLRFYGNPRARLS
jgi:hypothetical protein